MPKRRNITLSLPSKIIIRWYNFKPGKSISAIFIEDMALLNNRLPNPLLSIQF